MPIIGPVQENDTSTRVKAMKKMLSKPVVFSALLSIAVDQLEGRLRSNAPKNEMAKTTSKTKNIMLKTAPVAISFSFPGPKITVSNIPKTRKITMMLAL